MRTVSTLGLALASLSTDFDSHARGGVLAAYSTTQDDIQGTDELESLGGWADFKKFLADNEMVNPFISRDVGTGATSVVVCVGTRPVPVTTGLRHCSLVKRQTPDQNFSEPGIVIALNYTVAFLMTLTMTTRKTALFFPGALATVDLVLPAIEGNSVNVLVRPRFSGLAAFESTNGVPVYVGNYNCAFQYSGTLCLAATSARVPFVVTGSVYVGSLRQNDEVVGVKLDGNPLAGRFWYVEVEGNITYHATRDYDPSCTELTV
ncbi:hypothetical protein C8R44DRAFT_978199 [Mycena epipterygia]|nr:hypothetical protein C8R44DRAFT_978199 [Mycena epipterygia]